MPRPFDGASGATSRFDFAHRRRLGIDTERSRSFNGTVGQTGTDPNALAESGLWVFSGDIENLSCLVEQGISDSDLERISRHSVA